MLEHPAELADLVHSPKAQLLFARSRLCHVRKLPPCAAWRMENARYTTRPAQGVTFGVVAVAAEGRVMVDLADEKSGDHHSSGRATVAQNGFEKVTR